MTLRQIEYLVAVADHGSISRASDFLGIRQPTLTYQLSLLEEELGYRLFHRHSRGVTILPVGQVIVERARKLLHDAASLAANVESETQSVRGEVRLGILAVASAHYFPQLYHRFSLEYPLIKILVQENGSQTLIQSLLHGDIDLAIVDLPVGNSKLDIRLLWKEELVVVLPPRDSLHVESVELIDLSKRPFISFESGYGLRNTFLHLCHQAGFEPHVVFECLSIPTMLGFVAAGVGLAIAPWPSVSLYVDAGIVRSARLIPLVFREIAVVRRQNVPLSPSAEALYHFFLRRSAQIFRQNPAAY